jgi:hypothetical protein
MDDLTGRRFGKLTVVKLSEKKGLHPEWDCICDCGKPTTASATNLKQGNTASCSCLQKERASEEHKVHGLACTPAGYTWTSRNQRCCNENNPAFDRYGGRGIAICEFLKSSPANIILLLGAKPSSEHSVDRIDNDGSYSCGCCADCLAHHWALNVRWATPLEQNRNKRNNKMLTIRGETKCLSEWSEVLNLDTRTIVKRFGKPVERRDLSQAL